jgi:predicted transposase YbfD/YdcC
VAEAFEAAAARRYRGVAKHQSKGKAHGRLEQRTVRAMRLSDLPANSKVDWRDLDTIVQVDRQRTVDGHTSNERHFYITNLAPDASRLAEVVRAHWSVENQLHWCLDVGLGEDDRRIRDRRGATNFATLARFVLAMLKRESSCKRGIAAKRRRASWSSEYLVRVLAAGIPQV